MKRGTFILLSTGAMFSPSLILATIKKKTLLEEWDDLTELQQAIRDLAWDYGDRYGFEKTLTAIAWQESSFGLPEKLENPSEPSGGVFGNGYTTAARRHFNLPVTRKDWVDKEGITHIEMDYALPTEKQKAYVRDRLKVELLFSAHHAILQLQEGLKNSRHYNMRTKLITTPNWKYIWAYYNGGTNCMKEPLAVRYADDILAKIKVINKVKYNGA